MGELLPTPPVILSTSPDVVNNPKTAGPETVVRLQALDGTWETCGVDRAKGIFPENVSLTSDSWGPKTATFDLKRDGTAIWPDVLAFTPVKIEVDGQLVWSGRVSDTPSRNGTDTVMSIQCEGWQHHLDDDAYKELIFRSRMDGWVNTGTLPGSDLTKWVLAGKAELEGGALVLGFPAGTSTVQDVTRAGVTIDLGEDVRAKRIWVNVDTSSFSAGAFYFLIEGHNLPNGMINGPGGGGGGQRDAATTGTTFYNAPGTGFRYWSISVYKYAGGTFTETSDKYCRLTSIVLMASTGFDTSGVSTLKASSVITRGLTTAPLLSSDTTMVQTPLTSLAEYAPDEIRTLREHINAVNGFHGWTTKVDAFRRVNFYSKPLRPKYDVGNYSYMETSDSAGSSGADIYNKVIVTGTDPGGKPVSVTRYANQQQGGFSEQGSLYWPNPSFTTDTSGWVADVGSISRTTTAGEFDSSPAAGKVSSSGGIGAAHTQATGQVRAGLTYKMTFRARASSALACTFNFYTAGAVAELNAAYTTLTTSFQTYTMYLTTKPGDADLYFATSFGTISAQTVMIDELTLQAATSTMVDRQGFTRAFNLQVNSVLPSDGVLAASIGDAWLANHSTTTFKGDVTLTGQQSLRDRISGQPVPLYDLLANTDELMFFSDRPNPDGGGHGRTARVTGVTYTPADDKAVVTLDNTRTNFDVLLNRLGATS